MDEHVPVENILLATFTEKAAKELITRISNRTIEIGMPINISDMLIGTLHSIFLRLLDEYRQYTTLKRNYRTLDGFDQQYLIYQNNKRFDEIDGIKLLLNNCETYLWSSAQKLCSLVNKVSEENLDLDLLAKCENDKLKVLATVVRTYRSILAEENALDFSLIQTHFWHLLKNEEVLGKLRQRIRYLMVDEYQDTNIIQEQILLKLASPHHRICAVGDDDQALYRFRGATVENILRFRENFPSGCQKIELTKNYIDEVPLAQIKHAYSFTSHILVYENCPVQYKFFRELEFTPIRTNAVMFGTLVHQTIEDVHRAVLNGHAELVTHESIDEWLHDNYRQLSRNTGLYLSEGGLGVVRKHVCNYVEYAQKNWSIIRYAEVPVTLQQPKFILEGKIDLIRGDGNSIELLDFKSEKKPDRFSEDGRDKLKRYKRQLEIYAYLIEKRYGMHVTRMHLYYTGAESESPFISFDYNAKSIQKTIAEVTNIVDRIETKDFRQPPTKRCNQLCGNCDLKHFCDNI